MMYGYAGYGSVMSGGGPFGSVICLVIFIDLVLVGVWLWQQIDKK